MGALFVWAKAEPKPPAKVGDRRTVSVFLLWPKCLEGQWRWMGFERVVQEFQRYRVCPPDMQAMDVVGWRSVAWDVATDRDMAVRKLAARLWLDDGGHMPYRNGGVIHEFMVQHPDTRMNYERLARDRSEFREGSQRTQVKRPGFYGRGTRPSPPPPSPKKLRSV